MAPALDLRLDDSVPADLATVDALARLQLGARRVGCAIRLIDVPEDVRALIALVGLDETLRVEP
jgi:ABC-type transporter Mla MlaB component